jgi:hypothetical protein
MLDQKDKNVSVPNKNMNNVTDSEDLTSSRLINVTDMSADRNHLEPKSCMIKHIATE